MNVKECSRMKIRSEKITIVKAKEIDMVQYLASIGYRPVAIKGKDHWYLSPLRNENTASFKVNTRFNKWYDNGLDKGGNPIDFGILYFKNSVSEFLDLLRGAFPFQQQPSWASQKGAKNDPKIIIEEITKLTSSALRNYLCERNIDLAVATQFCNQIHYSLNNKKYYGIGFKNDAGGWEIRNKFFKTSSHPKAIRLIKNNSDQLAIFEGFMDFFSFINMYKNERIDSDYLILNSLAFFQKAMPDIQTYSTKKRYLDRDDADRKITTSILATNTTFIDSSNLYDDYKDRNEWYVNQKHPKIRSPKRGRSL